MARARGGSGLVHTGARRSRARRQAQATAGLRAVVAQGRGSGRNVIGNEVGAPFKNLLGN